MSKQPVFIEIGGDRAGQRVQTRLHHFSRATLCDFDEENEHGAREHLLIVSVDVTHGDGLRPSHSENGTEPRISDDRVEVARVLITTFPVSLADEVSWMALCFTSEESHFFSLVEHVSDHTLALLEGDLLYAKHLDVHRAARGQGLGLRLLLEGIRRSSSGDDFADMVVLIARPQNSMYEPEKSDQWRADGPKGDDDPRWVEEIAASHRLADYYRRLGFESWTDRAERTSMQVLYVFAAQTLRMPPRRTW